MKWIQLFRTFPKNSIYLSQEFIFLSVHGLCFFFIIRNQASVQTFLMVTSEFHNYLHWKGSMFLWESTARDSLLSWTLKRTIAAGSPDILIRRAC